MFSLFFINRPVFAKVISIFITVIGMIAIFQLPIAQFPEMTPPMVSVTATYTGASAGVVEDSVTRPIEDQINGVEGMMYMTSTSTSDGQSTVNVYFNPGYSLSTAAVDVQNRVSIAEPQLPEDVKRTGVSILKKNPSILQFITITSDNPLHDYTYLSNFAKIYLVDELKRTEGVGDATIFGELKYSMRIWIDSNKLSALGMTPQEVINAVKAQSKQVALGKIGQAPMPSDNQFQYSILSKTRLDKPAEFEQIVIKARSDGTIVRLKDLARVELGAENYSAFSQINNAPASNIAIYQLPGANALDAAQNVQNTIERIKNRFPAGIHVDAHYDTTKFVKVSMEEVVRTLFEALILVIVVVYLFLQSWRTTLIPSIAVPVSLIGTFALMLVFGFSINTLTLFGLILAIGIVVDDAIIVVENVERILDENPDISSKEATIQAMKEISGPVIATTAVLMAVFVPVAFIPGFSGALYQQFALTIALSVFISAINALTLSPALSVTLLHRAGHGKKAAFFRGFDAVLEWFRIRYISFLRKVIHHWVIAVGLFVVGLVLTIAIFKILPTGFIPDEDQGTLFVVAQLQPGTAIEQTGKISEQLQKTIMGIEGVNKVIAVSGFNFLVTTNDSSVITMFVVLKPWDERTSDATQSDAIVKTIKQKMEKMDNIKGIALNPPAIPGVSSVGGFEMKLQDYGSGSLEDFEGYAKEVIEKASKDPRIMYATTSFKSTYPQMYLDIDRNKAQTLDVNLDDVFNVLQSNLGSSYINDFNKYGKTFRVYIQADQPFRAEKGDIGKLFVKNSTGAMVPLSSFIQVRQISGPMIVEHFNGYRAITVNGLHNIRGGYGTGDAIAAMEEIAKTTLPQGYGFEWSGMALQEKIAGNAAVYVFALSIFFVFLFLAAQYESWVMPAMIMIPIPVVMLGALGASASVGLINNIYAQIGMVLLMGMSSKNAILIVEFAKELREGGMGIVEAAIEASDKRMRPIIMMIFAFLLGILPLVVAHGAGAASRNSLGTAVFGGMVMATVLTLLFTPVLFVLLEQMREKFSGKKEESVV